MSACRSGRRIRKRSEKISSSSVSRLALVASASRIVPGLRGQNYTDDEKATVQRNVARVRAAADWIEGAVATGQVTPEEGLARLLAGE